ncbi:unnamed protein product [Arctia plantaginis]|uniref:Uncharacterized protein n=1 Tax=Arctia plantaginis TaxID=874455 RepID=A0A8S1BMJ6_ARCPL|nr:unnamed protein product [Arctia plantaginis]
MLQFLILCVSFQSALLSTVYYNHYLNLQNGVTKDTSEKILDTPLKIEEEPLFNDNVIGKAAILNIKSLENINTNGINERDMIITPNSLNEKLTLNSPKKYLRRNVSFEIESKRRKRSVNDTSENVTTNITLNITQNNVTAPLNSSVIAEDIIVDSNRYNDSGNELTLDDKLPTSSANSSLNKDVELNLRRSYHEKDELRNEIENIIRGIKQKVLPLTNVKKALGDNYSYRIGYVIANIDTLYNQLGKIKVEMNFQDEYSLKKLFERMKMTDNVISNLLEILTSYLTFKKASSP